MIHQTHSKEPSRENPNLITVKDSSQSVLSKLVEKLKKKEYRSAFVASQAKRLLPLQIQVLRRQRNWTQARLAEESQLTQGVVSRAEDPDYGNLTVNTLIRLAAGFDVAFIGRFIPFSELANWYTNLKDEKHLEVVCFAQDKFVQEQAATGSFDACTFAQGTSSTAAFSTSYSAPRLTTMASCKEQPWKYAVTGVKVNRMDAGGCQ